MNRDQLKGVIVIMPTALNSDGSIDEENYKKNIQKICECDVEGIMLLGGCAMKNRLIYEDGLADIHIVLQHIFPGQNALYRLSIRDHGQT